MAPETYDMKPVIRITIDAIGSPGQRVFLMQASASDRVLTLKLEKEQAHVLALSIDELLEELDERYPPSSPPGPVPLASEMLLQNPIEPEFVIGQMGLGYDEGADMIVLIAQELVAEEDQKPSVARFWASRAQMQALSRQAKELVEKGRPICQLCNRPIDPDGHFCPRSNGHERPSEY